jgi:hypothetical protein
VCLVQNGLRTLLGGGALGGGGRRQVLLPRAPHTLGTPLVYTNYNTAICHVGNAPLCADLQVESENLFEVKLMQHSQNWHVLAMCALAEARAHIEV